MDIRWSHGFTTRATNYPCSSCKATFRAFNKSDTVSFATDDLKETVVETGKVSINSDNFCHYGSTSGLNCLAMVNENIIKVNDDWGWLQPNGQITWSSGFTTKMLTNECKVQEAEAAKVVPVRPVEWSWGNN